MPVATFICSNCREEFYTGHIDKESSHDLYVCRDCYVRVNIILKLLESGARPGRAAEEAN